MVEIRLEQALANINKNEPFVKLETLADEQE